MKMDKNKEKYEIIERKSDLRIKIHLKRILAKCEKDNLSEIINNITTYIEKLVEDGSSTQNCENSNLKEFYYPYQWRLEEIEHVLSDKVTTIEDNEVRKQVLDRFEIDIERIQRIQNLNLYHQYFFIKECLNSKYGDK